MKKTTTTALLLATVCLMAACTKEGVYNPSEKISKIYEENSDSYQQLVNGNWETLREESYSKQLRETWTWDGKKVSKISYGEGWEINFTYDGKQLTKIDEGEGDYVLFTYDGSKLSKFEFYSGNELQTSGTVTHDGKKVSQIVVAYNNSYIDKSTRSARFFEKAMQLTLPVADHNALTMAVKGAKEVETVTYNYTWDGDNISKQVINEGSYTVTSTYTYDNKTNPYKGFVYALEYEGVNMWCSKNNVLTETDVHTWDGENEEYVYNYSYTYDGKWPVSKTLNETYVYDEYRSVYTSTIYYEY